jgi:hypothetical protein
MLSAAWMSLGQLSLPVFMPLLALKYELSGAITGLLLCMLPVMTLITSPIIVAYAPRWGIELTIFVAGILFGVA